MKKLIYLLAAFALLFCLPSLSAQDEGREAEVVSFTEYVDHDSLAAAGDDIADVISQFVDDVNTTPPAGAGGWLVAVLGLLASLFGALKKWWPWFRRIWSKVGKDDLPVLIFALAGGLVWSLLDLDFSGEEWFLRASGIFTSAVLLYKAFLKKLFGLIFKKKESPQA